jgi:hypothetical protein
VLIIERSSAFVSKGYLFRLAWGLWLTAVIGVSLLPVGVKQFTRTVGPLHHLLHMVAFAGITVGISGWARERRRIVVATLAVVCLGALVELLQHHFYRDVYEWADVLDDGFGGLVGFVLPLVFNVLPRSFRTAAKTNKV